MSPWINIVIVWINIECQHYVYLPQLMKKIYKLKNHHHLKKVTFSVQDLKKDSLSSKEIFQWQVLIQFKVPDSLN